MSEALAIREDNSPSVLAVIAEAVQRGADVATMERLLALQERVLARDAEIMFNQDMKMAQEEMRPIVRDAENNHTRSRYARLETIDAAIRPIYTRHGFALTFNSGEPRNAGAIRILCDVRHIGGHSKPYELEGDLDTAGSQGKSNKTSIQGLGSSVSYLRRYLTCMIFNITLTNEDKDGQKTGDLVNEEQLRKIRDMINALEWAEDSNQLRGLLAFTGVAHLEALRAVQFEPVMETLRAKYKKQREAQ